jgi:hypothetical protein
MTERRHADPAALRQAINARLRVLVREDPQLQPTDLQRQFACDRFLPRVFLAPDRERWVLNGAAALLARLHTHSRHALDSISTAGNRGWKTRRQRCARQPRSRRPSILKG